MTVWNLSTKQKGYANLMLQLAVPRFGQYAPLAAAYAIAASGAESSLRNCENGGTSTLVGRAEGRQLNAAERAVARQSRGLGDGLCSDNLDSMGLFAQRPMSGWGTPQQIMNPTYSITQFYNGLAKVAGWEKMKASAVIARVQGYYDAGVYADWLQTAFAVVMDLTGGATPPPAPDVPAQDDDLGGWTPEQITQFAASGFARFTAAEQLAAVDMTFAQWAKSINDAVWRLEHS